MQRYMYRTLILILPAAVALPRVAYETVSRVWAVGGRLRRHGSTVTHRSQPTSAQVRVERLAGRALQRKTDEMVLVHGALERTLRTLREGFVALIALAASNRRAAAARHVLLLVRETQRTLVIVAVVVPKVVRVIRPVQLRHKRRALVGEVLPIYTLEEGVRLHAGARQSPRRVHSEQCDAELNGGG